KLHPSTIRLKGWKEAALPFNPDMVLALDEAYCWSTHQLVRWASNRGIPSIYLSCQNIDRPLPPPFKWIESRVLQGVTGGWFLNGEAEERARRRGFKGEGKVIPLPVNPKDFPLLDAPDKATNFYSGGGPMTVGYAGRLVPEKGLDTLIEACAKTGDRLLLAGEGPDLERLKRLANDLGVNCEWLGSVPSETMPEVYSRMDVLALPSLETPKWKEQFGRVLVEAMASGVTVVGSETGEIPRVIGEAGLLFSPAKADELAQRLRDLKGSAELQKDLQQKGLNRVRENFTLEKVGEKLLALLNDCLSHSESV
ncbi:MAG: glycosyltransferase family 4 protein, partial [Candidatus Omnitrophica bacterium]|nr:glycosyltransferase family 4 protein [Candidatus Omnitrophota bacterium]